MNLLPTTGITTTHRLAVLYLAAPVALWLVTWLQFQYGIPLVLLLAASLYQFMRGEWSLKPSKQLIIIAAFAFAWTMTTTAWNMFDLSNGDWFKHRGVLIALANKSWPVVIESREFTYAKEMWSSGEDDKLGLLRYYLGYYLVPGGLANVVGNWILPYAVGIWTWLGLTLGVVLFSYGARRWKLALIVSLMFLWAGMDIPANALEGYSYIWELHPEWVVTGANYAVDFQLPSHVTGMTWVPQHWLPGLIGTLLIIQLRDHVNFVAINGLLLAILLLWSPMAFLGASIVTIGAHISNWRHFLRYPLDALSLGNLYSIILLLTILSYLLSDSHQVYQGWLFLHHDTGRFVGLPYKELVILYITEFAAVGLMLVTAHRPIAREPIFIVSILGLSLLPIYYLGLNHDLLMRGAIPLLVAFSYLWVNYVTQLTWSRIRSKKLAHGLLALFFVMSLWTPFANVYRATQPQPNNLWTCPEVDMVIDTAACWFDIPGAYSNYPIPYMDIHPRGYMMDSQAMVYRAAFISYQVPSILKQPEELK